MDTSRTSLSIDSGRPSAQSTPAPENAFTPQLLASHLRNEIVEIHSREMLADMFQSVRQVLSHTILPGLWAFWIGVG